MRMVLNVLQKSVFHTKKKCCNRIQCYWNIALKSCPFFTSFTFLAISVVCKLFYDIFGKIPTFGNCYSQMKAVIFFFQNFQFVGSLKPEGITIYLTFFFFLNVFLIIILFLNFTMVYKNIDFSCTLQNFWEKQSFRRKQMYLCSSGIKSLYQVGLGIFNITMWYNADLETYSN